MSTRPENAIEVRGVSKTYRIPHERRTTLVEHFLAAFRPVPVEVFAALQDVTLEVPAGSFVGIIGANGSGKSTLLKILAGLLVPDMGEVHVQGSLVPLLELGLGFHHELSVYENVGLYGAVLGYPRADRERRIDEVIAFAGLQRFRDAKLKSLSSGMLMRLAFSTAIRADADIVLLDEVLAVGDVEFQQKCFEVFEELKRRRKTIVLVSHDLGSVQRFCDRAFWLDKGRLVMAGTATEVVETYLALFRSHEIRLASGQVDRGWKREHGWLPEDLGRHGDGRIRYVGAVVENAEEVPVTTVRAGQRVHLRATAEVHQDISDVVFGFLVKEFGGFGGHTVYTTNTQLLGVRTGTFGQKTRIEVRFVFTAALMNGQYSVHLAAADASGVLLDWATDLATFTVEGSACWEGVADLMADFRGGETLPEESPSVESGKS